MKFTLMQLIMLALFCLFVGESQTMPHPETTTKETAVNAAKPEIEAAAIPITETTTETTTGIVCPPNSEYSCNKTCLGSCEDLKDPDFPCNTTCRCACNEGFVFESVSSNVCVPHEKCDCGMLAHFHACSPEQPSCDNPDRPTTGCKPMCVCNSDYAFSVFKPRICVPKTECVGRSD